MVKVLIKKLDSKVELPSYKTMGASGLDLMAFIKNPIKLAPKSSCLVPTGLAVAFSQDYEIQIRPRSGLAVKNNFIVFTLIHRQFHGVLFSMYCLHFVLSCNLNPFSHASQVYCILHELFMYLLSVVYLIESYFTGFTCIVLFSRNGLHLCFTMVYLFSMISLHNAMSSFTSHVLQVYLS